MKMVEIKTYEFTITNEERERFCTVIDFLRDVAKEIDNTIGEDYSIRVEEESYSGNELERAATLLAGLAFDDYQL